MSTSGRGRMNVRNWLEQYRSWAFTPSPNARPLDLQYCTQHVEHMPELLCPYMANTHVALPACRDETPTEAEKCMPPLANPAVQHHQLFRDRMPSSTLKKGTDPNQHINLSRRVPPGPSRGFIAKCHAQAAWRGHYRRRKHGGHSEYCASVIIRSISFKKGSPHERRRSRSCDVRTSTSPSFRDTLRCEKKS